MNESDFPLYFGDWIKRRRKALDLTQAELAKLVGCSVFAVRKIESGERRPSKQLAELFAQSLHIPAEEYDTFIKVARGERAIERLALPSSDISDDTYQPAKPSTPLFNLPVSLTSFVGREFELSALSQLLNDPLCRLLTLNGAGGIGKTRLAIEAASHNRERFKDGVSFVPLASLSSSAFLVQAIGDSLSFSFQGQIEPLTQLLEHLSTRQVLLVLDNFEHLLNGVGLLTEILESAPRVKLLTTSRERLNLQSEWVYTIQGLSFPPSGGVDRIEEYTSVELFAQSARRAKVDFILRSEDREAVARICQLVEGMPLSIELAAAWVSVLTCSEIAQEIRRSFDFLETSAIDMPERQRSQRAVFNHSWKFLSNEERRVLSELALFQGGFERNAASEVTGATLPTLMSLVSKSLVRRSESGRFDMHEVIRQYAVSYLDEDPGCENTCDRHCHYYLTLLRDQKEALQGPFQRDVIQLLKNEIDNIRVAWKWAVEHGKHTLISQALRSFGWLCNIGVMYGEGIAQIETVVKTLRSSSHDPERQRVLGMALAQQGLLLFRQGKMDQALEHLEESLVLLRQIDEHYPLIDPLVITGIIMHLMGEYDRAYSLIEEGLEKARKAKNKFYTAYALYNLGYIDSLQGRYKEGYDQMMSGLNLWRQMGDPSSIALGLNYICPAAIHLGYVKEAQAFIQESISLLTEVGDLWGLGTAYRILGLVTLAQGDARKAQTHLRKSLEMFEGIITGWDVAQSLIYLADATLAAGDLPEAKKVYHEALTLFREFLSDPLALMALVGVANLKASSGEDEMALGLAFVIVEHPAASHDSKERASNILAETAGKLNQYQVRSAREQLANKPLEEIVEMLLKE